MIKILPSGTSAKFSFGLRGSGSRTVRGRLGEGAREHEFAASQASLKAGWRDGRIDATLSTESSCYVRSIALQFRFHSPQSSKTAAVWTDSASIEDEGGHLSVGKKRRGQGVLWMSESPDSDGLMFRQIPPVEYPVTFDCRPVTGILEISWSVERMLDAGEPLKLPEVRMVRGERERLLDSWRKEWRSASSRPPAPDRRVAWMESGETSSPDALRNRAAAVKAARISVDWYALGPDYASCTGDWQIPVEAYRDKMGQAARAISEQAMVPGLRFAPFLASRKSALAGEHRDWLVKSANGKPVSAAPYGQDREDIWILDITHPEVRSHLREILTTMRDRWGFRAFVMERLDDLAIPGQRHGDSSGPGALYEEASGLIREALGSRVYVTASGIPLQVSAGQWDARYVSTRVRSGRGRRADESRIDAAFRMLHRAPWSEVAWSNASAVLPLSLFRGRQSHATSTLLNAAAISTGLTLLTGDPADLDDETVMAVRSHIDMFNESRSGRLRLAENTGGGRRKTLIVRNETGRIGLFNLSGRRQEIRLDREGLKKALGVASTLSAGDGAVFNSPEIHVALPPRGSRLFRG